MFLSYVYVAGQTEQCSLEFILISPGDRGGETAGVSVCTMIAEVRVPQTTRSLDRPLVEIGGT